jgi:indolepyruvate ferredoxin oxidoreductase alpha subunit
MSLLNVDAPGRQVLFMGNEAIARGALEAGVQVAAAYPGNPSSEIIGSLGRIASESGLYVEWSINEKVALEVAAAAAVSNLNALAAMKQNGLNVACDFLLNLNLTGIRGGLVIVVADDPSGISSSNEEDSRIFAKLADTPLLEPATFHEAKEMTRFAFELSRKTANPVIVRSVTRISHARGNVTLGPLPQSKPKPVFDTSFPLCPLPTSLTHPALHGRLERAREMIEDSLFNEYVGPDGPDLLVVTCGAGWMFSLEAVETLALSSRVGVLKIGTTWPLPGARLLERLKNTEKVLFFEEVDPVLENNVLALYALHNGELPRISFLGKGSGTVPSVGELTPELVMDVVSRVMETPVPALDPSYAAEAADAIANYAPVRSLAFCAGCPHRASLWAIKKALALDGRDGVLFGDIGCYSLGIMSTGFFQLKTLHAMGSGAGMACGFGKLDQLGATQPSLAVCGDSTFYHAVIPALINGVHHRSNFILVILDNGGTAMTGFQPHPGSPVDAMGRAAPSIPPEDICRGLNIETTILDPFDLETTTAAVYELMQHNDGPKVVILRQLCALARGKREGSGAKAVVDPEKCLGAACGCGQYCTRVFKCSGLNWNAELGKASVDHAVCTGCGVCANVCPAKAISLEGA